MCNKEQSSPRKGLRWRAVCAAAAGCSTTTYLWADWRFLFVARRPPGDLGLSLQAVWTCNRGRCVNHLVNHRRCRLGDGWETFMLAAAARFQRRFSALRGNADRKNISGQWNRWRISSVRSVVSMHSCQVHVRAVKPTLSLSDVSDADSPATSFGTLCSEPVGTLLS